MGMLTGVKQAEADEDDNGINDTFDEVIAQDESERERMRSCRSSERGRRSRQRSGRGGPRRRAERRV